MQAYSRASRWADGAGQGGCLDPARNGGLGRVWPRSQPELGISGLRELRHSHNDLFPSYVLRATGQDCPHSSLGPLRLRASFWWVVWAPSAAAHPEPAGPATAHGIVPTLGLCKSSLGPVGPALLVFAASPGGHPLLNSPPPYSSAHWKDL